MHSAASGVHQGSAATTLIESKVISVAGNDMSDCKCPGVGAVAGSESTLTVPGTEV